MWALDDIIEIFFDFLGWMFKKNKNEKNRQKKRLEKVEKNIKLL